MILSLDVSFRNMGWAVLHSGAVVSCGVVKTEKQKKKTVRVSDDNVDRCSHLAIELEKIIRKYNVQGVIGELPGGSQSAKAAASLAMGTAIAACVKALLKIPAEWTTPDAVKKAVTGKKTASKPEIMDKVISIHGGEKSVQEVEITKGKQAGKVQNRVTYSFSGQDFPAGTFEHIADAIGAYHALENDNLVKMFG